MTDENHDLTAEELAAAKASNMTPEEYIEWREVPSNGVEAMQVRLRDDVEHERLKRAVREALDARDADAAART
ncbi:MAG TPA: hypothetical protein VG188_01350 [Solirubrobacteraceae bacterium]|jgi:hypothetical protein|nr:hypothetical protein [Solirubrobacteraceae bacterium]